MSSNTPKYPLALVKDLIQSSSDWQSMPVLLSRSLACKMLRISDTKFDTLNASGVFKPAEVGSGRKRQYVREHLLLCYLNHK